jgi:hypothetical protein
MMQNAWTNCRSTFRNYFNVRGYPTWRQDIFQISRFLCEFSARSAVGNREESVSPTNYFSKLFTLSLNSKLKFRVPYFKILFPTTFMLLLSEGQADELGSFSDVSPPPFLSTHHIKCRSPLLWLSLLVCSSIYFSCLSHCLSLCVSCDECSHHTFSGNTVSSHTHTFCHNGTL